MLAYLETRTVDFKGTIDGVHVRCNAERHPGLARRQHKSASPYPYSSRLRVGVEPAPGHDDYDCVDDFEAEGLLASIGTGISPVIRLTPYGRRVANELRSWKSAGGQFADFVSVVSREDLAKVERAT
jgi:hypothetical protein